MFHTPDRNNRNRNRLGPASPLLSTEGSWRRYDSGLPLETIADGSLNLALLASQDAETVLPDEVNASLGQPRVSQATFLCNLLSRLGISIEGAVKTTGIGLVAGIMAQINPNTAQRAMYISLYLDVGFQLLGSLLGCYELYRPRNKAAWARIIKSCLDATREVFQGIAHADIIFLFWTEVLGDIVGVAEDFHENDNFPAKVYYTLLASFAVIGIYSSVMLRLDYWHRTTPEFVRENEPYVRRHLPRLNRLIRSFMNSNARRIITFPARWIAFATLLHATATVSVRGGYALSGRPESLKFNFMSESLLFGMTAIIGFGTGVLYETSRLRPFINYCLRLGPIYVFAVLLSLIANHVREQGQCDLRPFNCDMRPFYILEGATVLLMLTAPSLLFLFHACLRRCIGNRNYDQLIRTGIQVGDEEQDYTGSFYRSNDEPSRALDLEGSTMGSRRRESVAVKSVLAESMPERFVPDMGPSNVSKRGRSTHRRSRSWPGMFVDAQKSLDLDRGEHKNSQDDFGLSKSH